MENKKCENCAATRLREETIELLQKHQKRNDSLIKILEEIQANGGRGVYNMKEGDILSVSVKNTNKTLSQTIRGVFYSMSGGDVYSIAAQHSGVVTATGSK